ncbi:MAG TPA: cyclic nucleotide-binding domain-containing protein [Chthonomonadaceae bacterium]|nr:cyclic nucleotide-binding domain-containing protein [Chthonomonadaceae bacterium]
MPANDRSYVESFTSAVPARKSMLADIPALATLDAVALDALAGIFRSEEAGAGTVLCSEDARLDRVFFVSQGRLEVSVLQAAKPLPLWAVGPGEIFGEEALTGAVAEYTVVAVTPVSLLTLATADLDAVAKRFESVAACFRQAAADAQTMRFLKMATPLAAMDPARMRALVSRVERQTAAAGQDIVRQGEPGDACYLLRSGAAEVWLQPDHGDARKIATLRAGALFGERALLTGQPRNATVRAAADCELLVLTREDLRAALGDAPGISAQLLQLLQMRDRPCRMDGVEAHMGASADGSPLVILKNPREHSYYRLSPEGWFLWQRMDGDHTVRDLMLDYLGEYKAFAPDLVAQIAGGLTAAGFLRANPLRSEMERAALQPTLTQRALLAGRRALDWQVSLRNTDRTATWLYRHGVGLLYTAPAQTILALVTVVGFAAFCLIWQRAVAALHSPGGAALLWCLIPAQLFGIAVHEAGHAFTVKACGREVGRIGVGWYWFGPIAFVDTSDMWLAGKRARILVSLSGPYTNAILAGIAALLAWFSGSPAAVAVLWQFALLSYLFVIVNFNPLLEYDGYYVLMDWLDRPNLRSAALAWLGRGLPAALRSRSSLRGHAFDVLYGLGSVAYIAIMAVATLLIYRGVLNSWISRLVSPVVAGGLAWVLVAAIVSFSVLSVIGDLRSARPR